MLLAVLSVTAVATAACSDDNGTGPDTRVFNTQIDRMGRPAVATVFIPAAMKQAFNTTAPKDDKTAWLTTVSGGLQAFGQTATNANALANVLLPDILTVDASSSAGFLNGRKLADDVITAELGLIFGANAALNDDHVSANDKTFLGSFPYLAPPQ
jgi:hypothetical protein